MSLVVPFLSRRTSQMALQAHVVVREEIHGVEVRNIDVDNRGDVLPGCTGIPGHAPGVALLRD